MAAVRKWIRDRLYKQAGLDERKPVVSVDELRRTEWDSEFESLMRNRLIMGALRYGRMREKGKPRYDRIGSCIKRLLRYEETGNKELLVDVANLCLLEFVECYHPNAHFEAVDDGEHVKEK